MAAIDSCLPFRAQVSSWGGFMASAWLPVGGSVITTYRHYRGCSLGHPEVGAHGLTHFRAWNFGKIFMYLEASRRSMYRGVHWQARCCRSLCSPDVGPSIKGARSSCIRGGIRHIATGRVWCLPMQVGMGQAGALEPAPWHFPCMTAPSRKKRARGGQAGITRSASPCLYVFVVPSYIFL